MAKVFIRPKSDQAMNDVHLKKACEELGIPLTRKQANKWLRQEGAAYKHAMKIQDTNIAEGKLVNNTKPPQKA